MLLKQSVAHGVGALSAAAISFASIVIYTRLLAPVEYGLFVLVQAWVTLALSASVMWLCVTALRLVAPEDSSTDLLAATLMAYLVVTASAGCAALAFGWLLRGSVDGRLIVLGYGLFATTGWLELNLHLISGRLDAARCARINVARSIITFALGVPLAAAGAGAPGLLCGAIGGAAIPGVALAWRDWRHIRVTAVCRADLARMLHFGGPLAAGFVMEGIAQRADRVIVAALASPAAVGPYAVAFDLAGRSFAILLNPIGAAGLPIAARELERAGPPAAARQLSDNLVLLLAVGAPLITLLLLLAHPIANLMLGTRFRQEAGAILPIAALATTASILRTNLFDHVFHVIGATRSLIVVTVSVAATALGLAVLLVPLLDALGAALAMLAAQCIGLIVAAIRARRLLMLPWQGRQLANIALSIVAFALPLLAVPADAGLVRLLVFLALAGAAYFALLYTLNFMNLRSRVATYRR